MKNIILTIAILTGTLFAQSIEVIVTDLTSTEGVVKVSLFDSEKSYDEGTALRYDQKEISENNTVKFLFEDIPAGTYAITLYHDENLDNELNTGMFGIPTESYAFSNNARGSFGPASWSDSKFEVNDKKVTQKLFAE